MIDTNGLNAALTALIRPIVLDIVEREFSALEHIKSRVSEAHQTLDAHRKLLANLETSIETLGKRVDDHKDEAEGVTDGVLGRITRLERDLGVLTKRIGDDMDNFAAGQDADRTRLDERIDYGETRLNEAREEIKNLTERHDNLVAIVRTLHRAKGAPPTLDINENIVEHIKDYLDSDLAANQVADMFEGHSRLKRKLEDAIDNYLERFEFVTADDIKDKMREILRDEVTIDINVN